MTDATLILMALDQAKFDVIRSPYHHASTFAHYSLALNGIQILVPTDQAKDAVQFITALERADVLAIDCDVDFDVTDATCPRPYGPVGSNILHALTWWIFGVTKPIRGIFVNHKP